MSYIPTVGIEMMGLRAHADNAVRIAQVIHPLLHGLGAPMQSAVLADLVATYLAGHHPTTREETLELLIRTIRDLIPVQEKMVFGDALPEGWETQ